MKFNLNLIEQTRSIRKLSLADQWKKMQDKDRD